MSKVTVALGSYIVGAISMFLVIGSESQTSTFAQARISGPGELIVADSVPVVPTGVAMFSGIVIDKPLQQLDGFGCVRCTLKVPTFAYGGGPVILAEPTLPRSIRLILTGASANTLALLIFLKANGISIENFFDKPNPKPNEPMIMTASITQDKPMSFALETPFGIPPKSK
jgi:hypothetical protein